MTLNTARVTFEEQELLFKKSDYIANPMREESPVVTGSFIKQNQWLFVKWLHEKLINRCVVV